jgi:hypothetical protein
MTTTARSHLAASLPIADRMDVLMEQMTLDQNADQLSQYHLGEYGGCSTPVAPDVRRTPSG